MNKKDNLLDTQRRGSVFGTDPTQTHLNKKMVTVDEKPDTIKIYKDVMEQVRRAEEEHKKNPSLGTFTVLNWWKGKLAQYSARARARKQS